MNARFAAFRTVEDCFRAHSALFQFLPRYLAARTVAQSRALDPHQKAAEFAVAIARGGYSTNPRYSDELMALVNEYGLADPVKMAAYAMNPEEMAAQAEGPEKAGA